MTLITFLSFLEQWNFFSTLLGRFFPGEDNGASLEVELSSRILLIVRVDNLLYSAIRLLIRGNIHMKDKEIIQFVSS